MVASHSSSAGGGVGPIDLDAVLFDLDGVLAPTNVVHRRAWARLFDELLAATGLGGPSFQEEDYLAYVDGRPRLDGIRTFLTARGVRLPEGSPADAPGYGSVAALGARKNELFIDALGEGIEPYAGAVAVLDELRAGGIPAAVVSSSRNAWPVLRAIGLADRFGVVVDGVVALERRLPGKPAPDTFLAAARELGAQPRRTAVIEDSEAGARAGRAGGFAPVVGVDRGAGPAALLDAGADQVVDDLRSVAWPRRDVGASPA